MATVLPLAAQTQHAWAVNDLLAGSGGSSPARRPDSLFSRDYLHLLADDTQGILTSPLRWERQEWLLAGGLTGLVAGVSVLDGNTKTEAQEERTPELDQFTKQAQRFGSTYSFLVLGGFEAYGYWAKDDKAKAVAMDGVTASIIASGIIAPVLKFTVGRVRPSTATNTFEFRSFSGNDSFPSGHTTQAFAVASVIAAHYDQWWVQGVAYGLAGVVGYSRIEQNAHFTSDVVAGAIIGTVVGRAIVHRHDRAKPGALALAPFFGGHAQGVMLQKEF
ncbi:MAG: phosphatase PAP2 family protein [Opitutae bacterium]|nr:phosphatase PAP2 family protein [Opitutae bacterium]